MGTGTRVTDSDSGDAVPGWDGHLLLLHGAETELLPLAEFYPPRGVEACRMLVTASDRFRRPSAPRTVLRLRRGADHPAACPHGRARAEHLQLPKIS
ncbi:hypothetical protein [Krasilnikovia cinnamomea]|nr:hypothetical protein [Krasilnikovia cinnamomea]